MIFSYYGKARHLSLDQLYCYYCHLLLIILVYSVDRVGPLQLLTVVYY